MTRAQLCKYNQWYYGKVGLELVTNGVKFYHDVSANLARHHHPLVYPSALPNVPITVTSAIESQAEPNGFLCLSKTTWQASAKVLTALPFRQGNMNACMEIIIQ